MLVVTLFWLWSSLSWFNILELNIRLPILLSLALVAFLFHKPISWFLQKVYSWICHHKIWVIVLAILFQISLLLSANMMIRSDAAVVYLGAAKLMPPDLIARYLTRNPNNIALFLYERSLFNWFDSQSALWILQFLNILYVHVSGYLFYRTARDFYGQSLGDKVFLFYLVLIGLTPKFMAMYSDILVLPLLGIQLYLILYFVKHLESQLMIWWQVVLLGIITALGIALRPTAAILVIAFFIILFFKKQWKKMAIFFLFFTLSFSGTYGLIQLSISNQKEVVLLDGKGLSKNLLTFVNLGLTFTGTDQKDMKKGLESYLPKEERSNYNNGLFNNEHQLAEIKRRLHEYTPVTFWQHILEKQYRTTAQGNLNWIYKDAKREKTAYVSPLAQYTKGNPLAKFFRDYFIYTDQENFKYYDFFIQLIWVLFVLGVVFFYIKIAERSMERVLSLALFGGLLFLQIFEGGKSRYLIQFLPQMLLIAAIGWENILVCKRKLGRNRINH
ncbi:glycosyltransferase family 39 protein [Streptococcus sp. X13SY08]|uniref:glycosyltransferase family 39 protein n=1 Tax=unclassified Streptococcus TaxID=2608887 RepID=UPI00103FC71D|nr:glycosyltransferase family 39 protein [Streptococcus sp. X13SY08]